jgi:hypothetical protein
MDALLGDDGDGSRDTWTLCDGAHVIVVSGRDGTSEVQLTDRTCE